MRGQPQRPGQTATARLVRLFRSGALVFSAAGCCSFLQAPCAAQEHLVHVRGLRPARHALDEIWAARQLQRGPRQVRRDGDAQQRHEGGGLQPHQPRRLLGRDGPGGQPRRQRAVHLVAGALPERHPRADGLAARAWLPLRPVHQRRQPHVLVGRAPGLRARLLPLHRPGRRRERLPVRPGCGDVRVMGSRLRQAGLVHRPLAPGPADDPRARQAHDADGQCDEQDGPADVADLPLRLRARRCEGHQLRALVRGGRQLLAHRAGSPRQLGQP